jgi:hypothetical protein
VAESSDIDGLGPDDLVTIFDREANAYWGHEKIGFYDTAENAGRFPLKTAQTIVSRLGSERQLVLEAAPSVSPDPDEQEEDMESELKLVAPEDDGGPDKHEPKAVISMSGTLVEVGVLVGLVESNPYIKIPSEMAEPVYFSVAELDLLVSSLCAVKAELKAEQS